MYNDYVQRAAERRKKRNAKRDTRVHKKQENISRNLTTVSESSAIVLDDRPRQFDANIQDECEQLVEKDGGLVGKIKEEQQDAAEKPQEQNIWTEGIDKDLSLSIEDDFRSQSLSGTTLVGAWKRQDEQWDAASVTDVGPYEAAREEFVSLIKNEKRLENVRDDIENLLQPETFEESFRNMLKVFAAQLRVEASHPEERDAARAANINRPYIANCVSEGIFKMAEFKPTPGGRDLLESRLLRYSQEKGGHDNNVQVFEGGEYDELENELEGPINLLKMEAFIESSKAWSELFDNLEDWVRDTKEAKGLEEREQHIDISNKSLIEYRDNSSSDDSPLASLLDRKKTLY